MKSFIKILFSSAIALSILSCGSDDEKPSINTASFLKEGSKYTMYYDDNLFFADTVKTVVEEQLGQDTFLIRNYGEEITTIFPTQYWVLKDDNFYTSFRLRDPETYQVECKFNKPVGTSWSVTKGTSTYTYTIDALNVSITTGDGTINDAIKIKMQSNSGSIFYQYISPTVGPLGNGSIDDNTATLKLIHYTIGTTNITGKTVPKITFGTFPFLKVNNYWTYNESSFISDDVQVKLEIISKDASKNIYKVKLTYGTDDPTYYYWYEDNGMLMVYEDGETLLNADAIYMNDNIAKVGYGWTGFTSNSNFYIYRIESINETQSTYFGDLPCMEVSVSNGLFNTQSNYWNNDKGNVFVTGWVARDIIASNARGTIKAPFIPIISFHSEQ